MSTRIAASIRAESERIRHRNPDLAVQDAMAEQIGYLFSQVERLSVELSAYRGVSAPYGCAVHECTTGTDQPMLIAYTYSPGSPGQYSGPPEKCYEADPPYIEICDVLVNGQWVDPVDLFLPHIIEKWEEELLDHEYDQRFERTAVDADEWRDRKRDQALEDGLRKRQECDK